MSYSYESEEIEGKHIGSASASILTFVLSLILNVFVYLPILYFGYIVVFFLFPEAGKNQQFILILLFAYMFYCLIYFIKGILVKLKNNGNGVWSLLWLFCVIVTCVLPAFMALEFLESFIEPSKRTDNINRFITWTGALLFSFFVYSRYQFKTDVAPKIAFWSYLAGFKLVK